MKSYKKYWKSQLEFDFSDEYSVYKNLCSESSKKGVDSKINTKLEWNRYLVNKYKDKDQEKMVDFYYYLRGKQRTSNIYNIIYNSLVFPILIAVLSSIILPQTVKFYDNLFSIELNNIVAAILFMLIIIALIAIAELVFVMIFNKIVLQQRDSNLEYHFYSDYMEVIYFLINKDEAEDDSSLLTIEKKQILETIKKQH